MRILLVIDGMHPRSGGPPAVVVGSAIALQARGHAVTVLSTVEPGEETVVRDTWAVLPAAGVELHFCAPEGVRGMAGFSAQNALVQRHVEQADVVHLHGVWNPILVMTGRIARRLQRPYFISVHGVFDWRAMERIRSKWIKKRAAMLLFRLKSFLDHAAAVLFGSASEASQSWIPSRAMRVDYCPNGADENLGTHPPTDEERARLHAIAPAVAGWQRTILCRSRIHEEKGIAMLVDAFNNLAPRYPGVGLLIAGMRQDEAYEASIARKIADGPVADRIVLTTALTGPTSQFLYQCCDIFAMPSIAEGFSMALVEGLANGRAMLITRYCHMPEVAECGAGLIAESTVASLTETLRAMLDLDDAALSAMGDAGQDLFRARFTWPKVAERLEQLYARAVDGRAA